MGRHGGKVRECAGIRTLQIFRWLEYRVQKSCGLKGLEVVQARL